MGLKVFISGATGFVGSHLIDCLDSPEYEIFGTSFPEKPKKSGARGHKIFYLDIRSDEDVLQVVREIQPDWIFHLAAVSNVGQSWEKRKETMEINLMGTFHLLESTRQFAPKARVLFVSSADVYGILMPREGVFHEEVSQRPANPYALTKICGEMLSQFYSQLEKLDIVIARSFPHTGPGQSPDFVCSDWAYQIACIEKGKEEPVIKVGNCKLKRDFTDVRDVVKAYILLLEKGRSGEAYNVSSGRAVQLQEVLDILLSFSEKKIEVEVDQQKVRKVDISLLVGDNRKIKKQTSWEPKIPLNQSLRDLLEYWRSHI